MRTTLDLPDETFRQLKAQAALRGFKLKELVAQFIERGLAASAAQPDQAAPRSPLPVAIVRDPNIPMRPALTNAELYALLDEEDTVEYHSVLNQSTPPQ